MLTGSITESHLRQTLLSASQWHPFPRISERAAWCSLPPAIRSAYVHEAETYLHGDWPVLKATEFLEFVRNGNRSGFQNLSAERRHRLATLVLAECIEGKGRFRDDIINGIWTVCEETYWGVPAHVYLQRKGQGLPDVTEPTVDLFSAETGSLLAWTYYLMKDSLDVVSPLVSERIAYEVNRRINAVNLARDDFWWMGLSRSVNNWTPWICSNWLTTVLVLEQDPERRERSVHKILECLDRFLAGYADDGGCDEGPSYWGRAAGSLFDCLELLCSSTSGTLNVFSQHRINEMGRYILRTHVDGSWFVNFADAPAKLQPDAPTIYRYGKAVGDTAMMQFGAWFAHSQHLSDGTLPGQFGVLGRVLPGLFVLEDLLKTHPAVPYIRDCWLPGIQVMVARSHAGSSRDFFLAVQGGNNGESHNHNDVGNFMVYLDGEPVVIDVGVETYTATTFGKDRYSIWTMQSDYHNLPRINGVSQKEGVAFAAKDVRYEANDARATLSMDIAGAYPPGADVQTWRRSVSLQRGKEVTIHDAFELRSNREPIRLMLMTCREPVQDSSGKVLLPRSSGLQNGSAAEILYDPDLFSCAAEPIDITDSQLQSSWGKRIWRIILTMKRPLVKGECAIRVIAGNP